MRSIINNMKLSNRAKGGSFNKDGRAIKNVCKKLNIPFTYKGIAEYIKG